MRRLLFLLFFVTGSVGAAPTLTVESLGYGGADFSGAAMTEGQITMPFVRGGADGVAAAINEQLFQGQFSVPAPVPADGHFTLPANEDGTAGMFSQSFTVTRNDDRILSIAFEGEGCGAYCENYSTYYSFEVKTGNVLKPDTIFTADGMSRLEQQLGRAKHAEHRKLLATLRQDLNAAYQKREQPDALNDLQERISLNIECVGEGRHTDRTPRVTETGQGFGYDKFEFGEKTFRLTRERCSNHAMRALDDIGNYTLELPYAALSPYLTDYGRHLLLDGPAAPVTGSGAEQIEDTSDEAVLFFPPPPDSAARLVWVVGGDPVPAGDGWWILVCDTDCALHAATLQVSQTNASASEEEKIPAQKLQWTPMPAGQVVAIFKPAAANSALRLKAGVVKTMDDDLTSSDTMTITIPLDNAQTALLVPRVASAGADRIDRLELRIDGKRQALPGYQLSEPDEVLDDLQVLLWAGDLDGDNKLDLVI
ncbi:MAG TPA: hypothetical protein VM553_00275, partial [Dongiaceae bacterium]|nr:hypothetical protein [Dongiaceae bacterium]